MRKTTWQQHRRWLVLFAVCACVLAGTGMLAATGTPTVAGAAEGAGATHPVPAASGPSIVGTVPQMDVQVWPSAQPGRLVVIVGVVLPPETELPATVRLPVIAGMSVTWAGEILGESASEDVSREATVEQGPEGQYAEFVVSKSYKAQVELEGAGLLIEGAEVTAQVEFVQSTPAEITAFSVRLPAGVRDVEIDPAPAREPDRNESGEALYTLPSAQLAEGASQVVAVKYSTGAAAASGAGSATAWVVALGVLLVIAVILLLVVTRRPRPSIEDVAE